jgi:hypothetical protein
MGFLAHSSYHFQQYIEVGSNKIEVISRQVMPVNMRACDVVAYNSSAQVH